MVLVLALNEVPDTESSDLIGHSDFRVAVGEKLPSQVLSSAVCARYTKPVGKCEEVGSFCLSFT